MKYLAILRDSVREAIDAKVLYVMIALSGVIILLCLAVSFVPRPAKELNPNLELLLNTPVEEQLQELKKKLREGRPVQPRQSGFGLFQGLFKGGPIVTYHIDDVKPEGGAPDNPGSPFVYTIRAHFARESDAAKAREAPGPFEDTLRTRFAAAGAGRQLMDVVDVQPLPPDGKASPAAGDDRPLDVFFELRTRPNHYTRVAWPHTPRFLFWDMTFIQDPESHDGFPLGMQVSLLVELLANAVGATVILLVSVVLTSLFIPNMLRKGTVDLLLVKPIRRWALLLYKYIGGLTFIALNTAVLVGGVWLAFGLRDGVWANNILLIIPVLLLVFATLYAVSTLCAVWTRSAIVAILLSCLVWGALLGESWTHQFVHGFQRLEELTNKPVERRLFRGTWVEVLEGVHRVLPRYRDLVVYTSHQIQDELVPQQKFAEEELGEDPPDWRQSLLVTGAYLVGLLGLSCVIFALKDY